MKVLIIGGGVMGCGIALELSRLGAHPVVLERSIPGAEASSAAGGILAPQMEAQGPGPLFELCLRSRAMYGTWTARLAELTGVDVGYRTDGLLHAAFTEAGAHKLEATVAWQRALGLRAELLATKDARTLEPELSEHAVAAAHYPDDHQVDNRLLVRALSMAVARAGVEFRTGYVRGIWVEGQAARGVDLDGQKVAADAVVVAAGSWSGLVPGSGVDPALVRPARGQMLQLQTRLPVIRRVLFSEKGYLVPRVDGRLIAGSTMELVGFEKQVTAEGLARILSMALELCPALATAPVQEFWAGLRPYTEDHLPILGPGPLERLFLATGHFRNGILLAPITAKLTAELVLGREPSLDVYPFRFDRFGAGWSSHQHSS